MGKALKASLVVLLIALIGLSGFTCLQHVHVVTLEKALSAAKLENEKLKKEIESLTSQVKELNTKISQLENEKAKLEGKIKELNEEKNRLTSKVIELNGTINKLLVENEELKKAKSELESKVSLLEQEKSLLEKQLASLQAELESKIEELEKVKSELEAARASISALRRVEKVTVTTLAVDQEGRGVALKLEVFTRAGKGNVLIDISGNILYDETVQESMLIAVAVAQEVTKRSLINKDLYFRLINPFEVTAVVGGGSAGAAMCIATIALLTGKSVKPSVAITGTIKPDGTIGRVGGLRAKALAAKAAGITVLLVPKGQGAEVGSVPGLTVVEVSNIREAMAYMLA